MRNNAHAGVNSGSAIVTQMQYALAGLYESLTDFIECDKQRWFSHTTNQHSLLIETLCEIRPIAHRCNQISHHVTSCTKKDI